MIIDENREYKKEENQEEKQTDSPKLEKETPEEATADEKESSEMGVTSMNTEEEEYNDDDQENYQELLEQLAMESGCILTWNGVEPPKWGKQDGGVDYYDDVEWDNEDVETWLEPEEVDDREWENE
ncbi:5338_t:CDS:2 [Dentiscutata heterogama]|uniref:5338_t:CDS:1 n=1 Tax=Dentiscutata heterogama TaxID=1316150 RepID=A0ACA9LPU8_9GLOM|nr:5338_t:CDS:2 [Dentiscutata heterogama]